MNRAKRIAVVVGVGLALMPWAVLAQAPAAEPAPAPAAAPTPAAIPPDQQPTKEQLGKLFDLMRVREQLASVSKMMPDMMRQQMQSQVKQMQTDHPEMATMTEEQQHAAGLVVSKYMEKTFNLYPPDEMIADMSALYQKHLTRSDVDGMIVFFDSPAGQHMLDMAPVIMQEFTPMVMQRVQERTKPLMDDMSKEMEEVMKPPAAAAPPADKPAAK
jgi:uncharacterized protein